MDESNWQEASPEAQYAHFLAVVAQEGIIWGLYDEQVSGWALTQGEDALERMPLWHSIVLAGEHMKGPWKQMTPQGIDLQSFIENWIDELEEMERGVSLVYQEEGGLEVALPYLKRDLIEAIDKQAQQAAE